MTTELEKVERGVERAEQMSVTQIAGRVNLVHQVLERVMKKGTHYGTVPGCGNKFVLLKPGADVLAMTFRLVPQFKVDRNDLSNGHREYDVTCSMFGADGTLMGQGVGSASTMEKKYRYRKDERGAKIENEDIADVYNTVLKIAKKRAHVDATLTVTGAADLFTQDLIEDEDEPARDPIPMPKPKASAPPAPPPPPPAAKDAPPAEPEPDGKPDGYEPPPADYSPCFEGLVERVSKKANANKPGTFRYGILIHGAEWVNTFDENLFDGASRAKDEGRAVKIAWKETRFGKEITGMKVLGDAAEPDRLPPEPEPEAEQPF